MLITLTLTYNSQYVYIKYNRKNKSERTTIFSHDNTNTNINTRAVFDLVGQDLFLLFIPKRANSKPFKRKLSKNNGNPF